MLSFPEIRTMVYTELKGKSEQFATGGLRQASEEIPHVHLTIQVCLILWPLQRLHKSKQLLILKRKILLLRSPAKVIQITTQG